MERFAALIFVFASEMIFAVCFASVALAQEAAPEPNRQDKPLGIVEIILRASAARAASPDVSAVVEEAQIEASGARNVAEAMEYAAGVDPRIGGRGEARVNVRGLKQRQVLVLLDGAPYADPYNNVLDLKRLSEDNVAKIEIVKGATSVLHGPQSLGGVINIVTKEPALPGWRGRVSADLDEYGRWRSGLTVGGVEEKRFYRFTAMREDSGGFNLSDDFVPARNEDGGRRENSHHEILDGEIKVGSAGAADFRWAGTVGRRQNSYGMPPLTNDFAPRRFRFDNYDQTYLNLRAVDERRENKSWAASGYFSSFYSSVQDFGMDATYAAPEYNYETDGSSLGGDLSFAKSSAHGGESWTAKAILKRDSMRLTSARLGAGSAPPSVEDYRTDAWTLAAERRWEGNERLQGRAGVSWSAFRKNIGSDEAAWDGTTAWSYKAAAHLNVTASAGWKSRFPTPNELYEPGQGNPDLRPERAAILSLETRYDGPGFAASVGVFHNRIASLIAPKDLPGGSKINENIEKATTSGVELSVASPEERRTAGWANCSWLSAVDKTPETDRDKIQYMPTWKLNFGVRRRVSGRLSAVFLGSFVGKQYYYLSRGDRRELSPFRTFGLRAEWRADSRLRATAGVRNLLDKNYSERTGAPQEGRVYYMSVERDF